MFEAMTQEEILSRMIEKAETDITVVEGSFLYNAFSIAAVAIEDAYDRAEEIIANAFEDTCDREHLIRFARKKGMAPELGAKNVIVLRYEPYKSIVVGDAITDGEHVFIVTSRYFERIDGEIQNRLRAYAEDYGSEFNEVNEDFEPVEFKDNFDFCKLVSNSRIGQDEEDTETFRQRYFDALSGAGMFGNLKQYKELVESLDGVGKSYFKKIEKPTINGFDYEVYLTSEDYEPASSDTCQSVFNILFDKGSVGHYFKPENIKPANVYETKVEATLVTADGVSQSALEEPIREAIREYIRSTNDRFGVDRNLYINRIEAEVLKLEGVENFTINKLWNTTIMSSSTERLIIAKDRIVKLGEVVFQ